MFWTRKGVNEVLCTKLKLARVGAGLSQAGLSEKSGVSRQTISAMECGVLRNTTSGTLLKLAKALGTTVDELFFDEDG